MISPPLDQVSLRPLRGLGAVSPLRLRADVMAGLTVAVLAVPQAMAYAVLAGLPPVQGLYAAIVMSIVAALWGGSPFTNAGPTNTAALLTAAAMAPLLVSARVSPMEAVFALGVMAGTIRITMGVLRLGWLVRFVPEPAFLGFTSAAALLIALGQIHQMAGVATSSATFTPFRLWDVLSRFGEFDGRTLLLGLFVVAILAAFDRFSKQWPVALGAIVAATLGAVWLASAFPSSRTIATVRDVAPIPSGLPVPQWAAPPPEIWVALFPGACAIAVIGLIEAVSIAQALALKHKTALEINQEFFGQGVAQVAGAVCGGVPGSSSFSRSALIERCGGQSALANVFFGVFTASALLIFPRALEKIPLAALAGLLLFTGVKLFDADSIRRVWRTSRADFWVLAITFAVTFGGKIEWGFFVGVVAAMAVYLSRARRLQLLELVPRCKAGGEKRAFDELPYSPGSAHEPSDVIAISLHGDLFFAQASELRAQLGEIVRVQNPRFLIVRTRRAHSVDYSCWKAVFDFAEAFAANGGTLILTGVRADLRAVIEDAGMKTLFPPENIVAPGESAWQAFENGLQRIAALLPANARLSEEWRDYFGCLPSQSQGASSISNWRDPANDPATLGIVDP